MSPSCCSGTVKSARIVSSCCSVAIIAARLQILADIDARNADHAGEGRLDRFLVEHRADLGERRRGFRKRALRLLQGGFGADAGLAQPLARARAPRGRARAPLRADIRSARSTASSICTRRSFASTRSLALKSIVCTTPATCVATSTPWIAESVPIASISGFQVVGSTLVAETVTVGACMVAKNWPIIFERKKLNQTSSRAEEDDQHQDDAADAGPPPDRTKKTHRHGFPPTFRVI